MENKLQRWAQRRGYRVAWADPDVVPRARAEIMRRRTEGELEEKLFRTELATLTGNGSIPEEGTVLVVAVPRMAWRVRFELPDGPIDAILPPTYARYRSTFEQVRQELEGQALPGARVEQLGMPLKSVAARLGLVRYGLNNITYASGMGSYLQLCGYWSDVSLPRVDSKDDGPRLLDECEGCTRCRRACPTDAIGADRVLLRAERCLTLINECPGSWPDWVPDRAHKNLLGCLMCQRACPANPRLPIEDTGLRFSLDETRQLCQSRPTGEDRQESGIRSKLAWLGQSYSEPVLGRNLRALIATRGRPAGT